MSDTLTTLREKVGQLPTVELTYAHCHALITGLVRKADVLALLSSLPPSPEPGTCASCKHWSREHARLPHGTCWSGVAQAPYRASTKEDFGCTLHEPASTGDPR